MKTKQTGLIRPTAISFVGRIIIFFLAFINSIVVSRCLGPEGRGHLVLILQVPAFIMMCGSFNLGQAGAFYLSKDKSLKNGFLFSATAVSFLLGIFYALATLAIFPILNSHVLENVDFFPLLICLSILPLAMVGQTLRPMMLALHKDVLSSSAAVGEQLIRVFFTFIFLAVLGLNYVYGIYAALLGSIFLFIVLFSYFLAPTLRNVKKNIQFKVLRQLFSFGIWLQVANFFQAISYRLDIFLVNLWLSPREVGLYSLAVSLAEMLRFFPVALNAVMFPRIAEAEYQCAIDRTAGIFRKLILVLSIPTVLTLLVIAELVPIIFGEEFAPSVKAIYFLIPGIFVMLIMSPFAVFFSGQGYVRVNVLSSFIGMVITVTLDIIWIPKIGFVGAAMASALSYASIAVFSLSIFIYLSKIRVKDLFLFSKSDFVVFRDAFQQLLGKGELK